MHIILHASLFFVKYILVRKYILNYKLKKIKYWRGKDGRENWDSKSRKQTSSPAEKKTHSHLNTHTHAHRREEGVDCTDHLKHKKNNALNSWPQITWNWYNRSITHGFPKQDRAPACHCTKRLGGREAEWTLPKELMCSRHRTSHFEKEGFPFHRLQ